MRIAAVIVILDSVDSNECIGKSDDNVDNAKRIDQKGIDIWADGMTASIALYPPVWSDGFTEQSKAKGGRDKIIFRMHSEGVFVIEQRDSSTFQ